MRRRTDIVDLDLLRPKYTQIKNKVHSSCCAEGTLLYTNLNLLTPGIRYFGEGDHKNPAAVQIFRLLSCISVYLFCTYKYFIFILNNFYESEYCEFYNLTIIIKNKETEHTKPLGPFSTFS
jgi:hypothetical protein